MGRGLMIIVVGFTTIFTGIMFNLSSSQQGSSEQITKQYHRWLKNNATESVTNVALSKLYRGVLPDASVSFEGATAVVRTFSLTADSINQAASLGVEVATTYAGAKDTTYSAIMWPAYSYYYYFMDRWPSHRIFATNDTAWGPVHSNRKINISGTPVFMGRVSSKDAAGFNGAGTPKTYGGAEFETATIPVPNAATLLPLQTVIAGGAHVFNQPVWLIFHSDSTYNWSLDGIIWSLLPTKLNAYNGIIATTPGNDITIRRSTIAGRMTVYSGRDIVIEDSLTYKTNPIVNPFSQDYLGLIAESRVIFRYVSNTSMVVQASLIASTIGAGSVLFDNQALPNLDFSLTFFGSIVAKKDSLSMTTLPAGSLPVNSFGLNHLYDPRLRNNTPPYYPRLTNRIEPLIRGLVTAMN